MCAYFSYPMLKYSPANFSVKTLSYSSFMCSSRSFSNR